MGRVGTLLSALAFTLASWALYGYTLGLSSNQNFYLPWVLSRLDPGLFPGDPAVAAAGTAPTFFWLALAGASRLAGLEAACFAAWLLSRLVFAWATLAAARRLGAGRAGQALGLGLALFSSELFVTSPLPGDPMLHSFLDQTSFAWPFALSAFLLWWDGRKAAAALALGLLANFNVLVAALAGAWLGMDAALGREAGLKEAAAWLGLAAAGAAPLAVRLALHPPHPDLALMFAASPQTYLPSQWTLERWTRALSLLLTLTAVFFVHPKSKRLLRLLASALLLWLAAGAGGQLPALRALAGLQLFRLDVAVVWLGLTAAGSVLARPLASTESGSFSSGLGAAWGLATFFGSPMLVVWSGALLTALSRPVCAVLGATALAYALLSLHFHLGFFQLAPTPALVTMGLGAFVAIFHVLPARRLPAPLRGVAAAFPAAALAILVLEVAHARASLPSERPTTPAEAWARTTPKDTLFIVPPDMTGFRLRAGRPAFAEWSDFTMALWDRDGAAAWRSRVERLGVDWARFPAWRAAQERGWDRAVLAGAPLPDEALVRWLPADVGRLEALAKEAGAGYLVAPTQSGLPLPAAFEGGGLTVHEFPR